MNTRNVAGSTDAVTETIGEVFNDGSMIDLVRSGTESLQLVLWDGKSASISSQVSEGGRTFVAPTCLDRDLLRNMQFPTHPCPCGATEQLVSDLQSLFARHPGLSRESISILVLFALSTWFPECHEIRPSLSIVSPDASGSALLLRLLHCACRRSLHLVEATEEGLFALPFALHPTLLIDQQRPSNGLQRILRAMSRPRVLVARNGQFRDVSCAIAICSEQPLSGTGLPDAIQVVLLPTRGSLPGVDGKSLSAAADQLQAKLLQYRLSNFRKVQESPFEVRELNSRLAETARTLGSSIVDYDTFQARVIEFLKSQNEDAPIRDSTLIAAVVIEAGLIFSHEENRESAYVSEFADVANTVLKCRHEVVQLEARAVGDVLRSLGLFTQRLGGAGRGILLLNDERRRIHELAYAYDVPSIQDGIPRCGFCGKSRIAVVSN